MKVNSEKINKSLILLLILFLSIFLISCKKAEIELAYFSGIAENGLYNENLFYRNDLEVRSADPQCIYITEGEDEGWYYLYATSDLLGCKGIMAWKSKDLTNWEVVGVVFEPEDNSWSVANIWAPEVIYDDGVYYLFYSATNSNTKAGYYNTKYLGLASSDSPSGPFKQWTGTNQNNTTITIGDPIFVLENIGLDHELYKAGRSFIDVSPFIDPVTNEKYLYFTQNRNVDKTSRLWGMKMKDWATPDYSTVKVLTEVNKVSTNGQEYTEVEEGIINEAPQMLYRDGVYYLTYSIDSATSKTYSVYQAISDSPLGDFRKLSLEEGGLVLGAEMSWDHVSGSGHHCFVQRNDELWIVYHQHLERNYGNTLERGIATDKVFWVENENELFTLYANGPTYSLQPKISSFTGYENIAGLANIEATNTLETSSTKYLNDGLFQLHEFGNVHEFEFNTSTVIKLNFDDYRTIKALMVYNSYDYDKSFVRVDRVEFSFKSNKTKGIAFINIMEFDWDLYVNADEEMMRPGGSVIAEFNEFLVNSITIYVSAPVGSDVAAISDIVVLGK
jgi:GH43 family beta-xylosidase